MTLMSIECSHPMGKFPGDAFCTTDAQPRPQLHGRPAHYTPDWNQASASVEKLAALRPAILAPGHGLPMAGDEVE
jgi:glyoxylase-like metal-dependent hydrolase (beta-lactamase superfamily II)